VRGQRAFGHELSRHGASEVWFQPSLHVNTGELVLLGFRLGRELVSFTIEVGALGVGLRADRDVFAGGHGKGAGDEAGNAGDQDVVSRRIRRRDADDEAGGRDDAVVGAEHRRPQPADPLTSMALTMCHTPHSYSS